LWYSWFAGGEAHKWEWAGLFELGAGKYTWSCSRNSEGRYAESELQLLIVPAEEASQHGLEEAETAAEAKWGKAAVEVAQGGAVPIGSWAHLEMDEGTWVTHFRISPSSAGAYAFFTNHLPIEFEKDFHYLKDEQGEDVEPVVEESSHGDDEDASASAEKQDNWDQVIIGSTLTALPSLAMIGILGPVLHKLQNAQQKESLYAVLYALSSGALLGVSVFILLGEGLHLASEGKSEVDGVWTWGVAILSGWLLCVVIHQASHILFPDDREARGIEAGSVEAGEVSKVKRVDVGVATPVIFGDFWHNLVDGMIIGFSAKTCDGSMTWTIVGVTILHEVPQELADFVTLVTKANMKWHWAAALNFGSGLGAVFGAILAYETEVSNNFQGLGLAFGAGVYMYVAMTELAPSFLAKASAADYMMRFAAFVAGATAIGLVLLGHEHCSAPSADGEMGGHHGHGH
jgi:zinc transporter ZupT